MDNILETILTRTSVRSFTDQSVPSEMVETLLRCAMAAPSAKDIRPWEFIVVRDRETLDKLATRLTHAKMLFEAPLAIVVLGHKEGAPFWLQDAAAATQNILLAAHSLALGAVWTAACDDERAAVVREVLSVNDEVQPFCVIPIGYPKNTRAPKNKWDIAKIHYEKW